MLECIYMKNKDIQELIVASSNKHKLYEIHQILPSIPFNNLSDILSDIQQNDKSKNTISLLKTPEETGSTFFDNAMIKAQYYYKVLQTYYKKILSQNYPRIVVLAEDSGISIDTLGGAPGIFSARYGKDIISKEEQNSNAQWQLDYVLHKMKGKIQRKAHFTCSMVLLFSENNFVSSQATWHGSIIDNTTYTLHNGFGYDPIFYLDEQQCTSAMLLPEEKNILSHRAKALKQLEPILHYHFSHT